MKAYRYIRCSSCNQLRRDKNSEKNCVIYARKSTENQSGFDEGIANQVKLLFDLAAREDLKIAYYFLWCVNLLTTF